MLFRRKRSHALKMAKFTMGPKVGIPGSGCGSLYGLDWLLGALLFLAVSALLLPLAGCATTGTANVLQRPKPTPADYIEIRASGAGIAAVHGAVAQPTPVTAPRAAYGASLDILPEPHAWAVAWPDSMTKHADVAPVRGNLTAAPGLVTTVDSDPPCYHNPRGDKYHRDKGCRYVRADAQAVDCDSAQRNWKPCKTCGGGVD